MWSSAGTGPVILGRTAKECRDHFQSGFLWHCLVCHDVMIYCPAGPYTVYTGCTSGDPDCAQGELYLYGRSNQLGANMLFNYATTKTLTCEHLGAGDVPNLVTYQNPGSDRGYGEECTRELERIAMEPQQPCESMGPCSIDWTETVSPAPVS